MPTCKLPGLDNMIVYCNIVHYIYIHIYTHYIIYILQYVMLISLYSIYYRHQDAVFTINISIQYISVYISIYYTIRYSTYDLIYMIIPHTYLPYLLIHCSRAQAEPTCALEGLLFGLTKVAQDAYQVRSDWAITAHFCGNVQE